MSNLLLDVPVLALGTKIAIVDDNDDDAEPLAQALDELAISNHYYNVDIYEPRFPEQPLKDVEVVFMDLYFFEGFGVQFDPYACTEWLRHIVPSGQKYILVVWSRDAEDHTTLLLEAMASMDITMPFFTDIRAKQSYKSSNNSYDVSRLLKDVGAKLHEIPTQVYDYYGQILAVDDDEVLINCLLDDDNKVFEVRRFDRHLFENFMETNLLKFVKIKITNKPGSTTLDFLEENSDLTAKFLKPDPKGLEDIEWPKFNDDENNI